MDIQVIILYCLTDDMLHGLGHSEPTQRSMSDAEVITTALVAMRLFGGNFASARLYLGGSTLKVKATCPECSRKASFALEKPV